MMLLNRAGLRFEKWGKASGVYLGSLSYLFGEGKNRGHIGVEQN